MRIIRFILSLCLVLSFKSEAAGGEIAQATIPTPVVSSIPQAQRAFAEGMSRLKKNHFQQAINMFSMAIASDKNCSQLYSYRAFCQFELDRLDETMSDADHAIALDAKNSQAHHMRAEVYLARHNLPASLKEQNEACRFAPNDASRFYLRGKLHEMLGDKENAARDYQRCLDIDSSATIASLRLANLEMGMGKYQKAIDHYTQAMEHPIAENIGTAYVNRAACYDKLGKHQLAQKDRERAKSMIQNGMGQLILPEK